MAAPGETDDGTGRVVRQHEIAARAGVSISTVSRVLNGVAGISREMQDRVFAVAADLGYRDRRPVPTSGPRHVALFASDALGPNASDQFLTGILAGVEAECRRQGIHLSYALVEPGPEAGAIVGGKVRQNQIDGLLFLAIDDRELLEEALSLGLPTAVINAEHPGLAVDMFLTDNEFGPFLTVRHLVAHGHRRILHATHPSRRTLRRRHDAFRAALDEAGLDHDPGLVLDVPMEQSAAYEAMERALTARPPDYTAVVCVNDVAAIGVMRALREAGYRVPEDVSIVGFDDLPMVEFLSPPLTTVRVEREEIGALAVRRLRERAAMPTLTPVRVELATRLIERGSVGPARDLSLPHAAEAGDERPWPPERRQPMDLPSA